MRALRFAARTLRRQPARALLGILGIAAVGALLFDMLLLSRGLVLSMEDALNRAGFDVRVTATASLPGTGPRIGRAPAVLATLTALPEVDDAVALRFGSGRVLMTAPSPPVGFTLFGAEPSRRRFWTVIRGRDLAARGDAPTGEVLINEALAAALGVDAGASIAIRASCVRANEALPPVHVRVAGVARFPFDTVEQRTAALSRRDFAVACGEPDDEGADLILVATAPAYGPDQARDAIARVHPDLHAVSNAQLVRQLAATRFSYFRQISAVLATVTLAFGLLLITVLLTVSVNQRLGTIAALRAIGFSSRRMVADVLAESALMVGVGGALALPVGLLLAAWLDRILKRMPGLPAELHFFVYEPRALWLHAGLMGATALLAALYPVRLVSRLPIAATLRSEITS